MKTVNQKSALKILKREIGFLDNSLKNSDNPFHFFCFSTIKNKNPESRTVVLRNFKKEPMRLYFNTDERSSKVLELKKNNSCSALFYDNKRRVQLRLHCEASIHNNNQLTKQIWDKTPLQSRKCYMAPFAPGIELEKWVPNLPKEYLECDPKDEHSFIGFKNFNVIELLVKSFEIIELHYNGHIRFKLHENSNEIKFISS
tara:strand:- start:301 stop:900 length:600 start_codon:yes stop_codon:yes gene_type:complete